VAQAYVQGPRAAPAIVDALLRVAAEPEVEVVILTRGGGSFEDLLPFSDERLVRAVAACPIPIVTAVGHEQDTPLCDLAADVRASTPTAAARLVVPDLAELVAHLERAREACGRAARGRVAREREGLERAHDRLPGAARRRVEREGERLERMRERLRTAPALAVERKRGSLERAAGRLRALSPHSTLARGYAIVRAGDEIVRAAARLTPGTRVDVELAEGSFGAEVTDTTP
jgi:exodeoxyribonuclease VII large subunit